MQRRDDTVFGPEQLIVLCEAFDAAREEIGPEYDRSATLVEVGRIRLAKAVLSAHKRGARDAAIIKAAALRRMAMWRYESWVAL